MERQQPRPPGPGFWRGALAIFWKDVRIERRTGEVTSTAGFFAVLVCVLSSLAFLSGPETAPGALWLPVTFASVLSLSRTWQREREDGALVGLLLAPVPRGALFVGKALGVLAFLLVIEALLLPTVALLFHIDLPDVWAPLALLLFLGAVGVAGVGTLFGVMTVRTRARDLLLASVMFPMLAPSLLAGIGGTAVVLQGAPFEDLHDYLLLLGVFDVLAWSGGIGLFGFLVDE